MASSNPEATSRRDRSEKTRDRVLEVATELMARRGYSGTTISAISKSSGVMPASIYWHFESKEGLLAAVVERASEAWFEEASQVMGADDLPIGAHPHREGLRYILEERPEFYRVLMLISLERSQAGGAPLDAVRRVRSRMRGKLVERLTSALAAEGEPDPVLAQRLAGFATLLLDGLFVAQQIDPADGDELLARYDMLPSAMRVLRDAFRKESPGGAS